MISVVDFEQTARERLQDAKCLLTGNRFDGAVYLASYALEIAFKVRLCKNHGLHEFPAENKQCNATTKTWFIHSLIQLEGKSCLNLSGLYLIEWSNVKNWDIEDRYKKSKETLQSASDFLDSVEVLLAIII